MSAKFYGGVVRPKLWLYWLTTQLFAVALMSAAPTVGPLNSSASSIPVGVATSLTITAPITGATPLSSGVNLLQEDGAGTTLNTLGIMHDDGLNGDAIAGDGIYTLVVNLTPPAQTPAIYLQASAAFQGTLQRIKSEVLNISVTSPNPTVTINPTSLTFPAQSVGTTSSAESFTVTNSGSLPVAITSIAASGDFAISANACPATLAVGSNCAVSVTFTPTAQGTRTSSAVVTDNAAGSPQSVSLSGTGQATGPTITISPTSLVFPAQDLNTTSAPKAFAITNSGTQPVIITSVVASGDFAISANTCPASLVVGANCTVSITFTPTATGTRTSAAVLTDNAPSSPQSISLTGTGQPPVSAFTITSFGPTTGSIGTLVKVVLNKFTPGQGTAPTVTMAGLQGGNILAPVSAFSNNALSFVVPAGAGTGKFTVALSSQSATSSDPFAVTTSSGFTLSVGPAAANLIQGQSVTYSISLNSQNGFNGLAALSVSGLPTGVQSSFKPQSITAGQAAVLTLSAPATQSKGTSTLSVTASATIDGQSVTQTGTASLNVTGITTTFLGRTVVDDTQETPIAGVTVKFLGVDAQNNATGCSGQTVSDAGGNFSLTNLPRACTGLQLISYNGMTATSPAGKYAGVNLSYTLSADQVTTSPVLVHLPRIDNGETVQVQQNSSTDQIFTFQTIPGLKVIVYAGTKFTLDDGSQPNPFPLIAVEIPLDRLPEQMATNGMVNPFIVAFQPANAMSSQPVAVNYPNPMSIAPGTHATFMTLDPTRGYMVPYGTGTVSNDGKTFAADVDTAHPGHQFGIVHFDWHGPAAPPPPNINPGPDGCGGDDSSADGTPPPDPASCQVAGPVDVASGVVTYANTDLGFSGSRIPLFMQRVYRSLSSNPGPFGIGTSHNYAYALNTLAYIQGQAAITILTPDGNQFLMSRQQDGSFINSEVPLLRGATLTANDADSTYSLKWMDGSIYHFSAFSNSGTREAFLDKITDRNGNAIILTLNLSQPLQILKIVDPVGRSLILAYDSANRLTSVSDQSGRKVGYAYNAQGTLATFTDALGGTAKYTYDAQNNLSSITDPRGIVTERNVYNESFDGRLSQQTRADGGIFHFVYVLQNQTVPTSPVLQTTVIDPLGGQTIYRYSTQGFLTSVVDANGQQRILSRDPAHNNLVNSYTGAGVCPVCGNPSRGDVTYTFDSLGNVLTKSDALGNKTTFSYDARFNAINLIQAPSGDTAQLAYDSSGNLNMLTDPNGKSVSFRYNAFGQLLQASDSTGSAVTATYDAFGNLVSAADSSSNITSTVYDAISRPIQTVDPLGRTKVTEYDALGRVLSQTSPTASKTSFSYDAVGNLLSITDSNGNTTSFTYDDMNRLQTLTDALSRVEKREYDKNGNLVTFIDGNGHRTNITYDALNRPIRQAFQDGTSVAEVYDVNSRLIEVDDSVSGVFSFEYDSGGNLLSTTNPFGSINYTYDSQLRVVTRQVVGGPLTKYEYDRRGRLTSATLGSLAISLTLDGDGRVTKLTRTNGVTSSYAYDGSGRLVAVTHAGVAGGPFNSTYSYDPAGDLSSVSAPVTASVSAQNVSDQIGSLNLLNATVSGGVSTSYSYDFDGRLIRASSPSGSVSYAWDERGRLASILQPSGQRTALTYDFANNLIRRVDSGPVLNAVETFLVDDLTNLAYASLDTGDNLSVLSGRGVDDHFAVLHSSGRVDYGLSDGLNSTVATVDNTGSVTASFSYEPFGKGTSNSDYPFQFIGRVPIGGGLYNLRARVYDSNTGRFLSPDPLGLLNNPNSYIYPSDDPISIADANGLGGCFVDFPDYPITIPGTTWKTTITPGHAGVVGYDNSTGDTRYYEYGRYDAAQNGVVRRQPVPDIEVGKDGMPTPESLQELQAALSRVAGEGTRAVLSCSISADPKKIYKYAEDLKANPKRPPYSWNPFHSNTCRDFAHRALGAGQK